MAEAHALPDGDGSMETILASIRRIIREDDEGAAPAPAEPEQPAHEEDDLLVLDASMILEHASHTEERMTETRLPAPSASELAAALFDDDPPSAPPPVVEAVVVRPAESLPLPGPTLALPIEPSRPEPDGPEPLRLEEPLLAPHAQAAAAQAFAALQEAMRPEPPPQAPLRVLRSGGPTLEDMVREELRAQLKEWLDDNLPGLVERAVRQEIERLVRPG